MRNVNKQNSSQREAGRFTTEKISLLNKVIEKHDPAIVSERAMSLMRRLESAPPGITDDWKTRIKEVASAAYELAEALK